MVDEIQIQTAKGLFSVSRLADFFDVNGDTIIDWLHAGKLPIPDMKISRKAIYWKPETIQAFVNAGGIAA